MLFLKLKYNIIDYTITIKHDYILINNDNIVKSMIIFALIICAHFSLTLTIYHYNNNYIYLNLRSVK